MFGLKMFKAALLASALGLSAHAATAQEMIISTGLGKPHMWVQHYMDPLAEAIEKASGGKTTFTRFYAGELSRVGQELDALTSGTIQIAAPLLAPYHEGKFPLSDVTQLPAYGTNSPMVTRAFQKMLDSDVVLKDSKTFYQYELGDKGLKAWALGATAPYSISTVKKVLKEPADFQGTPLRAGSAIHTIVLEKLGATPVTIPGPQAYEALSRGTIEGIIIAISDWPSYSIQELLRHSIVDVSIGHWESYLAMTQATWDSFSDEQKKMWDETVRDISKKNAEQWETNVGTVKDKSMKDDKGEFTSVTTLSQAMQDHIAKAGAETWVAWIEKLEAAGHPAKAAAKLYAEYITAEGGKLPAGVEDYLAK